MDKNGDGVVTKEVKMMKRINNTEDYDEALFKINNDYENDETLFRINNFDNKVKWNPV